MCKTSPFPFCGDQDETGSVIFECQLRGRTGDNLLVVEADSVRGVPLAHLTGMRLLRPAAKTVAGGRSDGHIIIADRPEVTGSWLVDLLGVAVPLVADYRVAVA